MTADEAAALAARDPSVFNGDLSTGTDIADPGKVASGAGRFLARMPIPFAANMGGEELGAALGAALAPETGGISAALLPVVLGALGAGGGNVAAAKLMPESLGGSPDQSKTSAFLWGAGPAAVGRLAGTGVAGHFQKRGAEAFEDQTAKFEGDVQNASKDTLGTIREHVAGLRPSEATVGGAENILGRPQGRTTPPTGQARTDATFAARDAVMGPITRMREKVAGPLDQAYGALTSNPDPADTAGLRDAVGQIRSSTYGGVTGNADRLLGKIRGFDPEKEAEPVMSGHIQLPSGEIYQPGPTAQPSAAEQALGGRKKLPTWGDLARTRQEINLALRKATGSDIYALREARGLLDERLTPLLPSDITTARGNYLGFISNYKWGDINKLRDAGSPSAVSDWLFSRPPDQVSEIAAQATPAERAQYRELFADHILAGVDPAAPETEQVAALNKAVRPYLNSGVARDLGFDAKGLRDVVQLPVLHANAARTMGRPEVQRAWNTAFEGAAKDMSLTDKQKVDTAFNALLNSMTPQEANTVKQAMTSRGMPYGSLPVLPEPENALKTALTEQGAGASGGITHYAGRRTVFTIPYAASRVAMGGGAAVGYAAGTGMAFGSIMASDAMYRAFLRNGGAGLLARVFSSPTASAQAQRAIRALVILGGRVTREGVESEENQ